MRLLRKTKIIATLGPASDDPAAVEALFRAGVDVFRLNFSHSSHIEHRTRLYHIRQLEKTLRRPIGVIVDLQGMKFRIGNFAKDRVWLNPGDIFQLDRNPKPGDEKRVYLPHANIFTAAEIGKDVLIDDGKVRLRITHHTTQTITARTIHGGELSSHKGIHVPGALLKGDVLTKKDIQDFEFGMDMGADWIALSYVQTASQVKKIRRKIAGDVQIITKIENTKAVANLDAIIATSDAVMVARGDLGVELPPAEVPILQKRIVSKCRQQGKPVIIATQMLDSMVSSPIPTRAEASDVATAVYDGADAVALSAETSVGQHPVKTVKMMDGIIRAVEQDSHYQDMISNWHPPSQPTIADAISASAAQAASTLPIKAIITYTKSGSTARLAARERPRVSILGLSVEPTTARQLTLVWGVHSANTSEVNSFSDMVEKACRTGLSEDIARVGDLLVITAGVPFGISGTTNIMRIAKITSAHRRRL